MAERQTRAGGAPTAADTLPLSEAVASVVSDTDPTSVLDTILDVAVRLVDADDAACALLGAAGEVVDVVHHQRTYHPRAHHPRAHDRGDPDRRRKRRPRDQGLTEFVIAGTRDQPGVLRIGDVASQRGQDLAAAVASARPRVSSLLGVPVRARDRLVAVLYLTRATGRPPFAAQDEMLIRELAGPAGVAIANARAIEAGRSRERWLETLAGVVTDLLSGHDLPAVLPAVVRQARDIVEADGAAVALPLGDYALSIAHVDGFGAPELVGFEVPVKGTLLGAAVQRGLSLQTERLATDQRLQFRHPLVDRIGPAGYVPLGRPASAHGVLFVYNALGRAPFDQRAMLMLDAFASQVAVAMELAERRHDATRLALLEERGRIARDLHDVVIQRLFAIGLTLEGIAPSVGDHDAATSLTRAIDDIDQTIKEIRGTIFGLQGPAVPEYSSLRARVVGVVDQAMHSLGFVPSLRFEGLIDTSVPGRLSDQVVAVLREALSNAARHAHAAGVDVKLSVTPERLTLLVEDDGIGFRRGGSRSGLRNMEERAAAYGGRLMVAMREPSGTHLEWTVPLRPPP